MSGFSTGDMVYLKRLLRAIGQYLPLLNCIGADRYLGGTLSIKLSRQTTHLVSAASSGQKYDKSIEWGVSVVRDSWLFAMGQSGQLHPEADHRHDSTFPATAPSGPKLAGRTGSTTNMSAVSVLNEPVDFARIRSVIVPGTSSIAPPKSISSVSPTRKLKLKPTHIDGQSFSGSVVGRSSGIALNGSAFPLSPPKPERERLLNHASPQTIDAKLARTTSAPPAVSPRSKEKQKGVSSVLKASTMGASIGRKEDMTEVLRQLAQTDQTTPGSRIKIVRLK